MLSSKSYEQHASGKVRKGDPRRSVSSDKQSTNQMYILSLKVTFYEIPLRDVHRERTGRVEARKYLRKSCCHRIECFAANFLATFM